VKIEPIKLIKLLGTLMKSSLTEHSPIGNRSDRVLCYRPKPASRTTVRRHYAQWRQQQGIPVRCDIIKCVFHTQPLIWHDKPLPLILDHENGNKLDNSPQNLRYICPNCDAQLSTRGGANRGRVQEAEEGRYVLMSQGGKRHYHMIAEPGPLQLNINLQD
jgi:hypothetical protein